MPYLAAVEMTCAIGGALVVDGGFSAR